LFAQRLAELMRLDVPIGAGADPGFDQISVAACLETCEQPMQCVGLGMRLVG